MFGNATQQSGTGLFGSTSVTAFGQQNKSTGFGFSSTPSMGLFSQTSQPQQTTVFQSGTTSSNLFGNSGAFGTSISQTGTIIKFNPISGTDSIQKGGITHPINTKHYCITCMKEYENKSLEELRWEDYQCNRKGQQPQNVFGNSQPFGATTTAPLFGQTENKPAFGQTVTPGFGQPNVFGMPTQSTSANIFAKSPGFGTTTTSNTFAFGTNTSSGGLFNSNMNKPFGLPLNQLFNNSTGQTSTSFNSNFFASNNPQVSKYITLLQ